MIYTQNYVNPENFKKIGCLFKKTVYRLANLACFFNVVLKGYHLIIHKQMSKNVLGNSTKNQETNRNLIFLDFSCCFQKHCLGFFGDFLFTKNLQQISNNVFGNITKNQENFKNIEKT